MRDYQERFENLLKEAVECELIARLAADEVKSSHFLKLAARYRSMADDLRKTAGLSVREGNPEQ